MCDPNKTKAGVNSHFQNVNKIDIEWFTSASVEIVLLRSPSMYRPKQWVNSESVN